MDANGFDRLTRLFAPAPSRRSVMGLTASGILASLPGLAETEAKKGKRRKKKNKKKGKKCKRPPCGPCTVSSGSASLVTESKLNKKPLRLQQTANFANGSRQTEVTFSGKSILKVTHEVAAPGMVTTVTYGGAFSGINQARFASDGVTVTGEIDGRAIVPLPADAGPSQLAFADGGAPLDVQGDARLVQAIQELFTKAATQTSSCQPVQRQRSVEAEDSSSSFDCVAKQAKCAADAVSCIKDVAALTASACNIVPIFGPLVCGGIRHDRLCL